MFHAICPDGVTAEKNVLNGGKPRLRVFFLLLLAGQKPETPRYEISLFDPLCKKWGFNIRIGRQIRYWSGDLVCISPPLEEVAAPAVGGGLVELGVAHQYES